MLKTFREMQREVQAKIQNTSTSVSNANDILPKVKDWINARYQRVYRSHFWDETIDNYDQTLTASTKEYAFDRDFDRVISIFDKKNAKPIELDTIQNHIRNHASSLDKTNNIITGDPKRLRIIGTYTVKSETSAADTVDIVSSSTNDISPLCVRVFGKTSDGAEIGENITLTGQSSATSSTAFSAGQKLMISIGTTDSTEPSLNGIITVSETSSGNVLTKISPNEQAHKYIWYQVSPTPPSSGTQATWEIWYQKQFIPLVNDNDIPIFDCCIEIIEGAFADALRDDGLEQEANYAEKRFQNLVIELQATRQHPMMSDQFRPMVEATRYFERTAYGWVV